MKKQNRKQGFTLVELLVVIAILAILATVSIVGYTAFIKKAHQSNANAEANQLKEAIRANFIAGEDFVIGEKTEGEGDAATTTTYILRFANGHAEYEVVTKTGETTSTVTVKYVIAEGATTGEYKVVTGEGAENEHAITSVADGVLNYDSETVDININDIIKTYNEDFKALVADGHATITLELDTTNAALTLVYNYSEAEVENPVIDLNNLDK